MKSRQSILLGLGGCLASLGIFELSQHFLWRIVPQLSSEYDSSCEDSSLALPIVRIVRESEEHALPVLSGFRIIPVSSSDNQIELSGVGSACCLNYSMSDCNRALEIFSQRVAGDGDFHLLHHKACGETMHRYDQVMVSGSMSDAIVLPWRRQESLQFSGPFQHGHPLVVLRLLLVECLEESRRVFWDSPSIWENYLSGFFAKLEPTFEVVFDSSAVHNGRCEKVFNLPGAESAYERSRLLNEELSVWVGAPHQMLVGTYSMPPLGHLAVALEDSSDHSGTFEIEDWGTVTAVGKAGVVEVASLVVNVVRRWLGLGDCGDEFCRSGISNTELIHLANRASCEFQAKTARNLRTLSSVLSALPRLPFNQGELWEETVHKLRIARETGSLHSARLGALQSWELLNDESMVAAPHFSLEFTFALYAPLFLPVSLPVLMALVRQKKKGG